MAVKDRRTRQKTLLRQHIIDAARDLLVRDGYDQLSMRRVADRIDYSPTAIYLHFKSKDDLIFNVCEDTFAGLIRELETLPAAFPDPLVRLRKGLERYVAFGLGHRAHYLAAFVVPRDFAQMAPETQAAALAPESNGMRAFAWLRNCLADTISAGQIRATDADLAARATWATVHGITSLLIVHDHFPWGDEPLVIKTTLDALVAGLCHA